MPKLSLWNPNRTNDYKFFDRTLRDYFSAGGVGVYVHKYIGVILPPEKETETREENDITLPSLPDEASTLVPETQIQDLFFLENRNRKYSDEIYEFRGVYTLSDIDADLKQFGIFYSNDIITLFFHYNEAIEKLGRKFMPGDVLEFPHLRERDFLDNSPAMNKYYVIEDVERSAEGFSPTWNYHVLRTKAKPIQNQEEFFDIINQIPRNSWGQFFVDLENYNPSQHSIAEIGTRYKIDNAISDLVASEANRRVPFRNFDQGHIYIFPHHNTKKYPPMIAWGDGVPPKGAHPLAYGKGFPISFPVGEYYLRIDYEPEALFQKTAGGWKRVEYNWRKKMAPPHRTLETFINNKKTHKDNNNMPYKEKTYLSRVIKPKVDFGPTLPDES